MSPGPAELMRLSAAMIAGAAIMAWALMAWGPATPPELSSDRIAECAWGTTCWHNTYYDAFVRNGLVEGRPAEGSVLGLLRYRIEAVTTQDLFTSLTILFSVLIFLGGLAYGRREQLRMHTVEVLMSVFLSDTLARENPRMANLMRRAKEGDVQITGDLDGADDQTLITMLDFYEFVAQSCFERSLSTRVVIEIRGDAMRRAYDVCRGYIRDRREDFDEEGHESRLYAAFERFVRDYLTRQDRFHAVDDLS
ncbi:DUF4760 domain-containing protein [Palleronia abyssalis]|uniref:DUF4760 domain-containing protein n=1 Tax=Palleronia abyssalis TaxID=1501240 RepID=UPI000D55C043|nr:hypothetical protein [Palleronia abyssalis]